MQKDADANLTYIYIYIHVYYIYTSKWRKANNLPFTSWWNQKWRAVLLWPRHLFVSACQPPAYRHHTDIYHGWKVFALYSSLGILVCFKTRPNVSKKNGTSPIQGFRLCLWFHRWTCIIWDDSYVQITFPTRDEFGVDQVHLGQTGAETMV